MGNNRGSTIALTLVMIASAGGLSACAQEEVAVQDCVLQEASGDYIVLEPSECDNDGRNYASTHGGIYPMVWAHSSSSGYSPGARVAASSVAAGSIARANDVSGKAKALSSTGLRAGSNSGKITGSKGGWGGGSRGGSIGG